MASLFWGKKEARSVGLSSRHRRRYQEHSFLKLFVSMTELSFSRPFVPWNIRSRDLIDDDTKKKAKRMPVL